MYKFTPHTYDSQYGLTAADLLIAPHDVAGPDGKLLAPTPDASAMKIAAATLAKQIAAGGSKKSAGGTRLVETSRRRTAWITSDDSQVPVKPPTPTTAVPLSTNTSMLVAAAKNIAAAPLPSNNHAAGGVGGGGDTSSSAASYAEAVNVLRTGVGASSLTLQKSPAVREALRSACFDLACTARAHLLHAREQAPRLPHAAHSALLPAAAIGRFLDRLESQNFDPFIEGKGLGPWVDDRVGAPLRLHVDLVWKTLRNEF